MDRNIYCCVGTEGVWRERKGRRREREREGGKGRERERCGEGGKETV